jgi:hypothetical protein
MKLLGFNFNRISAEKLKNISGKVEVKANIDIKEIKEIKSSFLKENKESLLKVDFFYSINYEPKLAKIELYGNLLLSIESEKMNEILKKWEDKKIESTFKVDVFNLILMKATVKTLELEEEIGLPLHISLPKIESKKKD